MSNRYTVIPTLQGAVVVDTETSTTMFFETFTGAMASVALLEYINSGKQKTVSLDTATI